MGVELYFSEYYGIEPDALDEYGAFDISVVSDLPLFVDPFLLFNSDKQDYQQLHQDILDYLRFLRDEASPDLDPKRIATLYRFKEVKQNWLGFTLFGNDGAGLGAEFAAALHSALGDILVNFGNETITAGSHLEKLCLIHPGVGRDNVSDFTTNLIKGFLCDYTEAFAREHIDAAKCDTFQVPRAWFNFETKSWATKAYYLPRLRDDFVLLTPSDMLTRDDTWINHSHMVGNFHRLPEAMPDQELRAQVESYFQQILGEDPDAAQKRAAVARTIRRYPVLIDHYIRIQEEDGDRAEAISAEKVEQTREALVEPIQKAVTDLQADGEFYDKSWTSYDECLDRAKFFKHYIEDNDGYQLFNPPSGPLVSNEKDLQLSFGLVWCGTEFDVNREVNNGRGPVDFKASFGAGDKSLIEFKLAKNTQLKRNLEKQVAIYQKANQTWTSVKVIVFYTEREEASVRKILAEIDLTDAESIVLIDARNDNKPSASKA